jgi:HPt (histidine-containing phosphotransfer) domain-containing protein
MGDQELAESVVKVFIDHVPGQLNDLRTRITQADAHGACLVAHNFKGAAATVSAESLCRIATAIEQAGAAGQLDRCDDLLSRAAEEFDRLKTVLQDASWA